MINLKKVKTEDREILWDINQKYLREMTAYYPDEPDENGNYTYGYFDAYFTEPERKAYFIMNDETIVGFAFINPYSYTDKETDNVIAEFSVLPEYRRNHYAVTAATKILDEHRGRWQIKFNEKNIAAKRLWEGLTEKYNPAKIHLNEEETVLEFTN